MYIVELLYRLKERLFLKIRSKSSDEPKEDSQDETLDCEHILIPIDSTKEVLACSKCGYLIRAENIPKKGGDKNFFVK